MAEEIIQISEQFWNIRGDFKVGGVLNIGTHCSLVKLGSGKFVLLDAYTLSGDIKEKVDELTRDGKDLQAIINLHPFHTIHSEKVHTDYPKAKLYGTLRHHEKFPDLPWQRQLCESAAFAKLYADDFEFSVPAGVDFISTNEALHFSSVLAYHKASKTIHVDDTLMYMKWSGLMGMLAKPKITFHPTLAQTLEKREGAVSDFRAWATELAEQWGDAKTLCAAHSATLVSGSDAKTSIADQILDALKAVERKLRTHERRYG